MRTRTLAVRFDAPKVRLARSESSIFKSEPFLNENDFVFGWKGLSFENYNSRRSLRSTYRALFFDGDELVSRNIHLVLFEKSFFRQIFVETLDLVSGRYLVVQQKIGLKILNASRSKLNCWNPGPGGRDVLRRAL